MTMIETLKAKLPEWSFQPCGKGGAVQCLPLHRQEFTHEALRKNFDEINAVAVISSTCAYSGFIVTQLRNS